VFLTDSLKTSIGLLPAGTKKNVIRRPRAQLIFNIGRARRHFCSTPPKKSSARGVSQIVLDMGNTFESFFGPTPEHILGGGAQEN